jgi:uncharacterized protein (DUF58 family)
VLLATRLEASQLPSSLHYALGPMVAFVVVLLLGALSRWWMAPTPAQKHQREKTRARRDFGLLVPVAVRPRRSDAEQLASLLSASGIRATVVVEPPGPTLITAAGHVQRQPGGRHQVLVFGKDMSRARNLLGEDAV